MALYTVKMANGPKLWEIYLSLVYCVHHVDSFQSGFWPVCLWFFKDLIVNLKACIGQYCICTPIIK